MTHDDDAIATSTTVGTLFAALAPNLPNAACRGFGGLYDDAAEGYADAQCMALDLCHHCPHLIDCTQWVASLPDDELAALGVVAGVPFAPVMTDAQRRKRGLRTARTATNDDDAATGTRERRTEAQRRRVETERRRAARRRQRLERQG